MSRKKPSKKKLSLKVIFKDILVCQKSNLKPYIEIFIQKPENIAQQKLGFLAGILEITDTSPDSAYIVNYLVSIIKKEYYQQTKRGAIESFEACLHKANLALAKLAEHKNINWIGKLNAVIVIIEKNNIHLAQTGNARALFWRDNSLKDLNEDATPTTLLTPLKTFIDIVSGRLEKNDQLILTTNNLFDIFSLTEIKRSLLNFSPSKFLQFLKTALTNELDRSAVLIIRSEEKIKEPTPVNRKKTPSNVFSQTSFYHTHQKKSPPSKASSLQKISLITNDDLTNDDQNIIQEIKNDLEKKSGNFVDKKTGHIYIKETDIPPENENNFSLVKFLPLFQEKTTNLNLFLQKKLSQTFHWLISLKLPSFKKSLRKLTPILSQKKVLQKSSQLLSPLSKTATRLIKQQSHQLKQRTQGQTKKIFPWLNKIVKQILSLISAVLVYSQKTGHLFFNLFPSRKHFPLPHIFPQFSRLKKSFSRLNRQQKYWALLMLLTLIVVPYFLAKIPKKNNSPFLTKTPDSSPILHPLYQDKNVIRIKKITVTNLQDKISHIINLNNRIFVIHPTSITDLADKKTYSFPHDFGKIVLACPMNDLNLIFLFNKQKKILSWSPISKKFQTNLINLPPQTNIISLKSYLTYLYFLDINNNQIYRYPRTISGFKEKVNWLKKPINLTAVSAMTINKNIFLAQKDNIIQFYRGKKQPFRLEKTATPIQIDKLYSQPNDQYLYILDKTNARIIKLDLNGHIITQYYNPQIKKATAFTVDEETQSIYFAVANDIESFKM